jgi:hypothetical protein
LSTFALIFIPIITGIAVIITYAIIALCTLDWSERTENEWREQRKVELEAEREDEKRRRELRKAVRLSNTDNK